MYNSDVSVILNTVPNTLMVIKHHARNGSTSPDIDDSPYIRVEPLLCIFTGLVLADENGVWHWEKPHQSAVLKVVQYLMLTLDITVQVCMCVCVRERESEREIRHVHNACCKYFAFYCHVHV